MSKSLKEKLIEGCWPGYEWGYPESATGDYRSVDELESLYQNMKLRRLKIEVSESTPSNNSLLARGDNLLTLEVPMKILIEYANSHHYIETVEKTAYFCPVCGKQGLWENLARDDYYQGCPFICIGCNEVSYIIGGCTEEDVIINQIKTGIMILPTTKRGT